MDVDISLDSLVLNLKIISKLKKVVNFQLKKVIIN